MHMCTAGSLYNGSCGDTSNPVYVAYARGIETNPVECLNGTYPSWDLITAYAAIVGSAQALMTE